MRVVCPAGIEVAETPQGRACRCTVERNTLSIQGDPRTLLGRCEADYVKCATWRAEKERIWAARRKPLAED